MCCISVDLLDDFDKELEHRGLYFVRCADDFLIFTRTGEAAARFARSIEHYLTRRLKLWTISPTKDCQVC